MSEKKTLNFSVEDSHFWGDYFDIDGFLIGNLERIYADKSEQSFRSVIWYGSWPITSSMKLPSKQFVNTEPEPKATFWFFCGWAYQSGLNYLKKVQFRRAKLFVSEAKMHKWWFLFSTFKNIWGKGIDAEIVKDLYDFPN